MSDKEFEKIYNSNFQNKNYFKSFEKSPVASASIGQVHTAYLKDGTKVAVKLRKAKTKENRWVI